MKASSNERTIHSNRNKDTQGRGSNLFRNEERFFLCCPGGRRTIPGLFASACKATVWTIILRAHLYDLVGGVFGDGWPTFVEAFVSNPSVEERLPGSNARGAAELLHVDLNSESRSMRRCLRHCPKQCPDGLPVHFRGRCHDVSRDQI